MTQCQEANGDNLGKFLDILGNNGLLGVFTRFASMRRF